MRMFYCILIVFALLVSGVTVSCSAEEHSSFESLQRERSLLVSAQPRADSSDTIRTMTADREGDNIDRDREFSEPQKTMQDGAREKEEDRDYLYEEIDEIADPFEPLNRAFFYFNDKLYFLLIRPVSKGYAAVLPEDARIGIRNFFNNITTPIRFVNNLLQFKVKSAGNELLRFGLNSTVGILGLYDFADKKVGIRMQNEDFGQTLGKWGSGPIFYINWPVLGPSSLRDSVGLAGDYFLDPVSYVTPLLDSFEIRSGDEINRASLTIGQYESIKKDALDPYTAFRDIYYQYRKSQISK